MFKFLHAADVHLDSPLRGLERYEGAPVDQVRMATRRAFENLVELAIDEKVAFLLLAGDLYDGDWKDYNTGLYMVRQLARLREAEIPVFLIAGNHDAANRMTRSLRLPSNVTMFPPDKAGTHLLDGIGVAIHGRSFAKAAEYDDLSVAYPAALAGYFNIGLLHTCAGREGHDPYAPCSIEGLCAKRYDYWALGHIHKREQLHAEPLVVFPGNAQGRHIRETGPKGCMLVTVFDNEEVGTAFHSLDVLRWQWCRVDASDARDPDAVLERVPDQLVALQQGREGRPLALRVEVTGSCPAHEQLMADSQKWVNEIRAIAHESGAEEIWIEKVAFHTAPPRGPSVPLDGALEELAVVFDELRTNPGELEAIGNELADLDRKLPAELKEGPNPLRLDDPVWLRSFLDEAQPLLVSRLLAQENER
jgi:DNA repair exonuclease SbcCD nuclease subunit